MTLLAKRKNGLDLTILQGAITVVIGLLAMCVIHIDLVSLLTACTRFLLPDYVRRLLCDEESQLTNFCPQPHNTRWLKPSQRRLAQVRLAEDAGEADEDVSTDSCVPSLEPCFIIPTYGYPLLGCSLA